MVLLDEAKTDWVAVAAFPAAVAATQLLPVILLLLVLVLWFCFCSYCCCCRLLSSRIHCIPPNIRFLQTMHDAKLINAIPIPKILDKNSQRRTY